MFIGRNFHVAMGGANVAKACLGNIVSTHSNMKVLNVKFPNTKQTRKITRSITNGGNECL